MKPTIYLLAILALFLACKGEKQNKETVVETTLATNVNIKDIFLLLPDNVFPIEEISVANRKLMLNNIGSEDAYDISTTPIDVYDVKNGYLSLTGMETGWEMCYWNLKDGRKLVAVNNKAESGSEIRIFFYQNGKLTEDANYQLGGNQNYQLTDFIDFSKLSSETRKFAEKQFDKGDFHIYYQLPQSGTSLILNIDTDQLMDYNQTYEISFEAIKDVIIKWKNEKWER